MTRKKDYKDEHPEAGAEERAEREPDTKVEDPAKLAEELTRARSREDELLRAVAELTNVNRRRKQDMESIAQLAQESLVRNLLPVLDDIDRAIAASKGREGDAFYSGLLMIRDRLWQVLSREGLEPIDALGAAFDPELHEAVAQHPSEDRPAGTILEVIVPGYRLRGRVLRHAQVVVAGPRQDSSEGSAGAGQASTAKEAGGSTF